MKVPHASSGFERTKDDKRRDHGRSAAGLTAGQRFDVLDVHHQWVTTGIER